jgi:ribosome-binding ATPase YchF (GTP1/OBG family)
MSKKFKYLQTMWCVVSKWGVVRCFSSSSEAEKYAKKHTRPRDDIYFIVEECDVKIYPRIEKKENPYSKH